MKIAFTSKGTTMESEMDPRFGRTSYILIHDTETGNNDIVDNTDTANDGHGAGPKTAQRMLETGATVLVTGNGPGGNAASVLEKKGIDIYIGAADLTIEEALAKYRTDSLTHF